MTNGAIFGSILHKSNKYVFLVTEVTVCLIYLEKDDTLKGTIYESVNIYLNTIFIFI
jgi:hypothetical protein